MRQNRKLFAIAAVAAVWLLGAGTPAAKAVFLSDLLVPGATLTVGDLTFSNFSYQPPDGPPAPINVTVTPFTDGFGNQGIQIGGGFSQLIPPEVNPLDVRLAYTVTSTVGLTDIHLSGNPAISPIGATGAVVVTESVTPAGGATLAPIQIYAINNISGQPVTQAADQLIFANGPYTSLDITKDILLTSGTGIPSISFINQTFSVPEPGSVILMGLGCLGMVGYGLKRRQSLVG